MKELLTEFLSTILDEAGKPAKMTAKKKTKTNAAGITLDIPDTKPPEAKFSSGGRWYSDEKYTDYVGRMYKGKWVPATAAEKEQEKTAAGLVDKGVLTRGRDDPERFMSGGAQQQPDTVPTSIPDPDKSVRDMQLSGEIPEYRPNDIVDGIFKPAAPINLGPNNTPVAVRQIMDETGKVLNITDDNQRKIAIDILTARIQKFHDDGTIKRICDILAQKDLPRSTQTQLNKWIGNLGEVCGLRDMLAAGIESYMLQDSNAKNDIISVIDCGDTGAVSNIQLVGISTKSSRGKKAGRTDADALPYISDTVAGKMVELNYGRGGRSSKTFKAENVATALFSMQKTMFRTLTRGTIEKVGSGKRKIVPPPPEQLGGYDDTLLKKAVDTIGDGGQRILMSARKITPADVEEMFIREGTPEKPNPVRDKFLSDLTRIMDNKPDAAKALIETLSYRLMGIIKDSKNTHFSLIDFNDWFTGEIANIIDKPYQPTHETAGKPSSLVFESDMMLATFDANKGYVGMRLVTGESMTAAVNNKYKDFSKMSTRDKLTQVLGWIVNPRGLVSSPGKGYVDAQQRAKPPLKLLNSKEPKKEGDAPSDYLTIAKFVKAKCK